MNHPIQPIEKDSHGSLRFKPNKIVQHLLRHGGIDLNQIACLDVPQEDAEQFAQLIGYSLSGFGELSYVRDETFNAAEAMAREGVTEDQARIATLETTLEQIRVGLRVAAHAAFQICPEDLNP